MRNKTKLLSLILAMLIVLTSLSSCFAPNQPIETGDPTTPTVQQTPSEENTTTSDQGGEESSSSSSGSSGSSDSQPGGENTPPEEESILKYTLSEQDMTDFRALLATFEELALAGTENFEVIDEAYYAMEDQYFHIATQGQIAYVLYCLNTGDEAMSDAYLESGEILGDAYELYNDTCKKIDASNSPYRESFFEGWSEEDLFEMRAFTGEITDLQNQADEIMVEARELNVETQSDAYLALYDEFVRVQNEMASKLGYSDYYAYATEKVYIRDYDRAQREALRAYVQTYIAPYIDDVRSMYFGSNGMMPLTDRKALEKVLTLDYDKLPTNYVQLYIDSFDEETQTVFNSLFEKDSSFFVDSSRGYAGAFTTYLYEYEKPICYFGPKYQNCSTMIHEMGHYYAAHYQESGSYAKDMAEVHSQGNEWLFYTFLKTQMNEGMHKTAVIYYLYNTMATILVSCIVDDFEEEVYTRMSQLGEGETLDFDAIMTEVCAAYGGVDFLSRYVADMNLYWKYVCIESPVYYISYSTSAIVSLGLYCQASEDYDAALAVYKALIEEPSEGLGFTEALAAAGLLSPFEESTFQSIKSHLYP